MTRGGRPKPEGDGRLVKQAYGNAFAIYALAAYHDASRDPDALRLALRITEDIAKGNAALKR